MGSPHLFIGPEALEVSFCVDEVGKVAHSFGGDFGFWSDGFPRTWLAN